MGIQTKEALIAEIERFKTESLKTHIVKVWAESYANTNPFDYVILEKENNKVWWMKTQAYQLWQMWQAAKAVPEGFVLVPKEPTPKMIDSTWDMEEKISWASHNTRNELIYKAMIEAQEPAND